MYEFINAWASFLLFLSEMGRETRITGVFILTKNKVFVKFPSCFKITFYIYILLQN